MQLQSPPNQTSCSGLNELFTLQNAQLSWRCNIDCKHDSRLTQNAKWRNNVPSEYSWNVLCAVSRLHFTNNRSEESLAEWPRARLHHLQPATYFFLILYVRWVQKLKIVTYKYENSTYLRLVLLLFVVSTG